MAGGDLLSRGGVIHIFDTVAAQHQPPVGLSFLGEVRHDALVHAGGLVELAGKAQPIGAGEQGQLLFVVGGGHRLL